MTIEIIISILGALGGFEFVKWLFTHKAASRVAEAQADNAEFKTLQETIVFLQEQLKEKEERFAKQTTALRELQTEVFTEKDTRHKAELELALKRCNDQMCPFRQPPNAYTPIPAGLTIEEYQKHKHLSDSSNAIPQN